MMKLRNLLLMMMLSVVMLAFAGPMLAAELKLNKGDRIVLIGNTLAERMQYFGHFETLLHARFPELQLVVRNQGFSADEVKFRPRSLDFGSPDHHLTLPKADVVLAFFGFNESFAGDAGLAKFEAELSEFITHTKDQKYNGKSAPRLVLVSPIAHEDLKSPNHSNGKANIRRIKIYTEAMAIIANRHRIPFVDLFTPTHQMMQDDSENWTFNGVHLSGEGYRRLAPVLDEALFGEAWGRQRASEKLRAEINEKNFQYFHRFRAVNGYYIYGGRSKLWDNNKVMETERQKLDDMAANRDRRIWAVARGQSVSEKIDDSNTTPLMKVVTNFTQPIEILSPEDAMKQFTVAKGYEVNLFASEREFPDLKNPVQLTFDGDGRLWVATMPSYPQYLPPNKPNDKLLIFEDTDNDGRADKQTVFADGLHVPTGFELGDGGVYVSQQPNVLFLKDTDGDGKADVRKLVLHGFDTGDTHHAIGAFTWGPGGGLYMHEGTFHHTAVETPSGPVRNAHAGIYRYDPTTDKFETFVHYNFANPWGHVFDRWGQNFVADASGGANYYGTAFSGKSPQFTGQEDFGPFKFAYRAQMKQFIVKRVRPTAGCEIVASRHFPPEAQGNFLLNNCIGFQGILQHTVREEGSGFVGTEIEPLLFSSDSNFRPTDLQFGGDGALYLIDWFNPLVGHMQHSIRDPNRDHDHGRIWRVTYKGRPLLKKPKVIGQPIPTLLKMLRTYEDRTRYHVRLELRKHETAEVVAELNKWIAGLDKKDPQYEHQLLEALWVRQHHNAVDQRLLKRLLRSPDYRARAAATRVLGYWRDQVSLPLSLMKVQANDKHPRVRLEAVRACSFFETAQAAEIALDLLKHPQDDYLTYTLRETMRTLQPYWKPEIAAGRPFADDNPLGISYLLQGVDTAELLKMSRGRATYTAMLTRANIVHDLRHEAIMGLAMLNKTDMITELLAAIGRLDKNDDPASQQVLHDLAHMLTSQPADKQAAARGRIETLASSAQQRITRQLAYVTLIAVDGSLEPTWQKASRKGETLRDLLDSVQLIQDAKLRTAAYEKVEPLLHGLPQPLAAQLQKQQGISGRFVRIELPRRGVLTLAEVEVFSGGKNIARRGKAKQSSVANKGVAQRGIDGNKSGVFADGGQTHTRPGARNPWWEVDLGSLQAIKSIVIHNRNEVEGKFAKRLDGYTIKVLDAKRNVVWSKTGNAAPLGAANLEVSGDSAGAIHRAAINAVTYTGKNQGQTFNTLADLILEDLYRNAAVQAMSRLPRNTWSAERAKPLTDGILAYASKLPAAQRTEPEVLDALQLGKDLSTLLPVAEGKSIRKALADLGVAVIRIRTVPHKMLYDRTQIYVEAGKPVQIVFENTDIMPHNLVVTRPGAMAQVGLLAEKMASQPDAFARHFRPDTPDVLHATRLVQPRQTHRLNFTAPTELGDYPYVCTFPGHWRRMYGTMHVVSSLENIPPEALAPTTAPEVQTRAFVKAWKYEDLVGKLEQLESGRSFQRGQDLFKAIACVTCHRINNDGGKIGPDLSEVKKKLGTKDFKPTDFLREIIEPSKVIDEKFRTVVIEDADGRLHSGIIVKRTEKEIQLAANPLDKKKPKTISAEDIEIFPSKISMMPLGLLNTMSEEEILDLMAYIASSGDPKHSAFKPKR